MEVKASLFGNLVHHMPEGSTGFSFALSLTAGATVQDMLEELKIPGELPLVVVVNGQRAEAGHVLNDHDDVSIFLVSGGG